MTRLEITMGIIGICVSISLICYIKDKFRKKK